ncbi:hypothetical protein BDR07DRAFT_1487593 [Suillus spraguei]|nr:hypothetical protein BDR07DRAFT_1487593 [Suillus spraguei]
MPRNPRPGADDGEDFEAEINAVTSDESNGSDGSDSEQSGSDLDQLRLVLAVPGPNAQMHERQYLMLSAAVPARSRNCILKKMSPLDTSISHQGQRYALYCHFWVVNGLFLTMPQPGVVPHSATRWTSPEAKLKGAMAELYLIIPKDLHHTLGLRPCSERSNILHSIKDCAGVVFSSFKHDPNLFANQPSKKQNNKDLLVLLKRNGEGDYICLAPVLFAKPNAMAADDFLKSVVLIKIVVLKSLGRQYLVGRPRANQRAGACVWAHRVSQKAHFLLTHDAELTAIGAETKIDYQKTTISTWSAYSKAHSPPSPTLSILSTLSTSTPTTAIIHNDHPIPVSTAMIQNFTSSTQMSVSQMHVDTSASTQLHFGINQLSLANKDSLGAVPPPLTTGSKVPAHEAHVS